MPSTARKRPSGDHEPALTNNVFGAVTLRRSDSSRPATQICASPLRSDSNARWRPSLEKRPGMSTRVESQNGVTVANTGVCAADSRSISRRPMSGCPYPRATRYIPPARGRDTESMLTPIGKPATAVGVAPAAAVDSKDPHAARVQLRVENLASVRRPIADGRSSRPIPSAASALLLRSARRTEPTGETSLS